MRVLNNGIGNNFGLVGKNIRRYLTTTALTATGLMAIASPALADNWTDHVATEGSISIDTTTPSTTNITQHTDFTKVQGDGDINAGWTVNVAQPSSSSKYVLYDTENDPTMILGALNANGEIYIFDKNGVIFDRNSQVNVGAIHASTRYLDDNTIKTKNGDFNTNDYVKFEGDDLEGAIINKGSITVQEAGLASFVGNSVKNDGVIRAKLGTVKLTATGEEVATADLYGDGLVSIALGEEGDALVENKGEIISEGGTVILTANAAKNAVDNVINTDGVIDVSSVTTKGGKIILGGGNKGVVKVAGKLKADGATGGGSVKVTGENIHLTETSEVSASAVTLGNGGAVDIIAENGLVYGGSILAKGGALGGNGGAVDTSGHGWVDIFGSVDVAAYAGQHGSWLIDPSNLTITDALPTNVGGNGTNGNPFKPDGDTFSLLRNTSIQNALNSGANVFITTVGTPAKTLQDGTITILSNITTNAGAESTLNLEAAGSIWLQSGKTISATGSKVLNVVMHALGGLPGVGGVIIDGAIKTNGGDVQLTADINNIIVGNNGLIQTNGGNINTNADFVLPTAVAGSPLTGGTIINGVVDAQGGNVNLHQSGALKAKANSVRTSGTGTIELSQSNLFGLGGNITIQNAIDAIQNTGTGTNTVNVSIGTYNETVFANVDNLILKGAWAGVNPLFRIFNPDFIETVIDPNSPGIHVTADNVVVDGFVVTGASGSDGYGVWVDGANNTVVKNNVIKNNASHGVYVNNGSQNTNINNNHIFDLGGAVIDSANAIYAEGGSGLEIRNNLIDDIKGNGILVKNSGGLINVVGNFIGTLATSAGVDGIWGDGIEIEGVNGNTFVQSNVISNTWDETKDNTNDDSSGVYLRRSSNIVVGGSGLLDGNLITNVDWDGVKMAGGTGNLVQGNIIDGATRIGIYGEGTNNATVTFNSVTDANLADAGIITLRDGDDHTISYNYVSGPTSGTSAGIMLHVGAGGNNLIQGNIVRDVNGNGIEVFDVSDVDIKFNSVTKTKGHGIYLHDSYGEFNVVANEVDNTRGNGIYVKLVGGLTNIKANIIGLLSSDPATNGIWGDGIEIEDVNGGTYVQSNIISNTWDPTKNNTNDNSSGIYLKRSSNIVVGGPGFLDGNLITNVDWDGVKMAGGTGNLVEGNIILSSTRIGIYGEGTNNATVSRNKVFDSNLATHGGIELRDGEKHLVNFNEVWNDADSTGDHGIVLADTADDSKVFDNKVHDVKGNGIVVENSDKAWVQQNYIDRVGLNGIYATDSATLRLHNNTITDSGQKSDLDPSIETAGIWVEKGDVRMSSNYIRNADRGIYVKEAPSAWINSNRVLETSDEGVFVELSKNVEISENRIRNIGTGADNFGNDGIRVKQNSDGLLIADNLVGFGDGPLFINGNGIRVEESTGGTISGNKIDNTNARSQPLNSDDASGVYLVKSNGITVDNNFIRNAEWDGVKMEGGGSHIVTNNDIANSTRIGIYGEGTDRATIAGNKVFDSNLVDSGGIELRDGEAHLVAGNEVWNDEGSTGYHGIVLRVQANDSTVRDNNVHNILRHGILVEETDGTDIDSNIITDVGYDGIHVHGWGEYVFNNVLIRSNTITNTGDDGIEVHDGKGVIEIAGNKVTNAGIYSGTGFDEFNGGNDGITVRNIFGSNIIVTDDEPSEDARVALVEAYGPSAIRITNNETSTEGGTAPGVLTSGDDGIEVVDADAYTYIVDNTVSGSGFTGSGPDDFGGDGIHVRNVFDSSYGAALPSLARFGDIGNGEYNIVISSNNVTDSQDDGIEVLGSGGSIFTLARLVEEYNPFEFYGTTGRVLVSQNTVTNSGIDADDDDGEGDGEILMKADFYNLGGDGIHVAGVNPGYYGTVGAVVDGTFVGYAVDVLNNTVTNSGDDGIEVINSSSTLIDQNNVSNSGLNGGDYWGGDGIHVNNVGGSYRLPEIYALEGPGDGYQEYSVVIRRNTVDNSDNDGIQVHNSMGGRYSDKKSEFGIYDYYGYTAPVLIGGNNPGDGNTVTDSGFHGLFISGPSHNNVIVSGNAFANFDTGGQFESGLIDLTGASNSWTNGFIGLRFSPILIGYTGGEGEGDLGEPIYAYLDLVDNDGDEDGLGSTPYPATPTNFGGTIGAQVFTGFQEEGDYYVYLDDGAFTNKGTPIWLNGLNSNYDGITPSLTGGALSPEDFNFLEARFRHYPDPFAESTDIFWFGFALPDDLALIAQEDLFNTFDPFNGDITGLNVRITGLPFTGTPGTIATPTAAGLNNIQTFAGGNNPTNPADLNNIDTAAGGEDGPSQSAESLANIETEAGNGGSNQNCWSNAASAAAGGQTVNVVYGGSFDSNLETAAACGTAF